jgi:uncharacterized coiled-coil DUF342 family protein
VQHEASREDIASFKGSKQELEEQLKLVNDEYDLAKKQMDERWAALQEARNNQDAVSKEFSRLKELKDEKFEERNAARDALSSAPNRFYDNRRFSQRVRSPVVYMRPHACHTRRPSSIIYPMHKYH